MTSKIRVTGIKEEREFGFTLEALIPRFAYSSRVLATLRLAQTCVWELHKSIAAARLRKIAFDGRSTASFHQ